MSLAIPVRMEQHVILVLTASLTTPAHVLKMSLGITVLVRAGFVHKQDFRYSQLTECVLSCPLGYEPNSNCTECVPVHICVTSNPCQNGATCNIGSNSNTNYTCSCTQNILGNNCTGKSWDSYIRHDLGTLNSQNVFSLVHWVMSQIQIVLNVFQYISVSPAIPVRMEQHVISEVTATLTTPARVLKMSLGITVLVRVGIRT